MSRTRRAGPLVPAKRRRVMHSFREAMTPAFIDSATLHDAFAALVYGKGAQWNEWVAQNLIECTWLLLFDNVKLVPGPAHKGAGAVPGYEAALASRLPTLLFPFQQQKAALTNTKRWLANPTKPFAAAWSKSRQEPAFLEWAAQLRETWWTVHQSANQGLFAIGDSIWLASLLGVSETSIAEAHRQSCSVNVVKQWSKGKGGDIAELAGQAYLASTLLRGKYHEYVARANNLQLVAHPFRNSIASRTSTPRPIPAPNSEQLFTKILIGSALLEPTADRRVTLWIDNIIRAREAIASKAICLPNTIQASDAEHHAVTAARRISLPGSAVWHRDILNWAIVANFALALGPWGLLGGLSLVGYKAMRGRTIGEELALLGTTDSNFQRLGRTVAGRIIRGSRL